MKQNKLTFENYSKHLNRLIPTQYHSLLDYDRVKTSYEEEFKLLDKYLTVEYYSCDTKYFFENWIEIRRIIFTEYDIFHLNKIRLSLRSEDKIYFENFKPALDQGMYAAPIANLIKSEIHTQENLRIEKIEQMTKEDYAIYSEEYNKFRDANPELTSIGSEPLETINQHCQKDYGFKLYVNDEWAGFALYASVHEYYLYGYLVEVKT